MALCEFEVVNLWGDRYEFDIGIFDHDHGEGLQQSHRQGSSKVCNFCCTYEQCNIMIVCFNYPDIDTVV